MKRDQVADALGREDVVPRLVNALEWSLWIVGYQHENASECGIRGVAVEADIPDLIVIGIVRREIGRIETRPELSPGTHMEILVFCDLVSKMILRVMEDELLALSPRPDALAHISSIAPG